MSTEVDPLNDRGLIRQLRKDFEREAMILPPPDYEGYTCPHGVYHAPTSASVSVCVTCLQDAMVAE